MIKLVDKNFKTTTINSSKDLKKNIIIIRRKNREHKKNQTIFELTNI